MNLFVAVALVDPRAGWVPFMHPWEAAPFLFPALAGGVGIGLGAAAAISAPPKP